MAVGTKLKPAKVVNSTYKPTSVTERKKVAIAWYKKLVKTEKPSASNFEIYRADHLKNKKAKLTPGVLLHFSYIAKFRNTKELPFFDAFPLALVIDVNETSLLSLNLHYLSPTIREKFLRIMMKNLQDPDKTDLQKVKFSYAMLKESSKLSFMKPAIKRHLFSQIKSKPIPIPPADFDKIIFLPSEDFLGATNLQVWKDSAKKGKV